MAVLLTGGRHGLAMCCLRSISKLQLSILQMVQADATVRSLVNGCGWVAQQVGCYVLYGFKLLQLLKPDSLRYVESIPSNSWLGRVNGAQASLGELEGELAATRFLTPKIAKLVIHWW